VVERRIERVDRRFIEWYHLHVSSGRIRFMEKVFNKFSSNIYDANDTRDYEKRININYGVFFLATLFFGINVLYFMGNVLHQLSIIDSILPPVGLFDMIEPIIQLFKAPVLLTISAIISVFGVESIFIAMAGYELLMLIFFIIKNRLLHEHPSEELLPNPFSKSRTYARANYEYKRMDDDDKIVWFQDHAEAIFWKKDVFGGQNKVVQNLLGDLDYLDGNHWNIDYFLAYRHNDPEKLSMALNPPDTFEKWSMEMEEIMEECRTYDVYIYNTEHMLTIHADSRKISEKSSNFPREVLATIKKRMKNCKIDN